MNTALADRVSSAFCGIAQWAGVWTLVGLGLGFGSDTVATPLADANQAHAQAMTRYYNALQALGPNPPPPSVQKLQTDILAPAQGERLNRASASPGSAGRFNQATRAGDPCPSGPSVSDANAH